MKIILEKAEVENAVQCYLSREGIDTDKYDLDIKIVVSRSSEDTKIEVDLNQTESVAEEVETPAYLEEKDPVKTGSPFGIDETEE